ncbi:MAG TPA: futalosine hydrolase [Mucilaginibacter sp.]
MQILIVAATGEEVGSLKPEVRSHGKESKAKNQDWEGATQDSGLKTLDFELLITGVGMVATAFTLGRHLASNKYDLAVNLGIAGSFDKTVALGDVLEISEDTFAELGAEDDNAFVSLERLGYGEGTFYPTTKLSNLINMFSIKTATAITVNTVHGNEASIKKVTERLNPQLESMEGAAFFYACKQFNMPCLQIRAVSNYVEKRNRDNWQIGLAIKNLNTFAVGFLKHYA